MKLTLDDKTTLSIPAPRGGPAGLGSSAPFLLVKCTAFGKRSRIRQALEPLEVEGELLGRFSGYASAAVRLYDLDSPKRTPADWLWLVALEALDPDHWDQTELWSLCCSPQGLPAIKGELRRLLGFRRLDVSFRGARHPVSLIPVHGPDPERLELEWEILSTCLRRAPQ